MKRWLREDDEQIKQRRATFVQFLNESFGIEIDPALFQTEEASYVQNNIGGVVPYSGSQKSGLRVGSSLGIADRPLNARQYADQRLIEMGFLYPSKMGLIKQV